MSNCYELECGLSESQKEKVYEAYKCIKHCIQSENLDGIDSLYIELIAKTLLKDIRNRCGVKLHKVNKPSYP